MKKEKKKNDSIKKAESLSSLISFLVLFDFSKAIIIETKANNNSSEILPSVNNDNSKKKEKKINSIIINEDVISRKLIIELLFHEE